MLWWYDYNCKGLDEELDLIEWVVNSVFIFF